MLPPSDSVGDDGVGQMLTSVDNIISALLQEYDGLKRISDTISPALVPLVRRHFIDIKT